MKFNDAFALLSLSSLFQVATCKNVEFATIKVIEDLPLDSNQRLADNWLLLLDTPECKEAFTKGLLKIKPVMRNVGTYSKSLAKSFKTSESTCNAITLTVGTKFDLLYHPLEKNKIELSTDGDDDIEGWINGQQAVEVGWTSYYKGPLTLYWIAYNGNRVLIDSIYPGEKGTHWSHSSLGHKFEITDTATDELVGTYEMKFDSFFVIGNNFKKKVERNVTEQVADTFKNEYGRSLQVKRTFTELGFSIGKLPGDLWGSISAYYYNNQMNKIREEWDTKGVFVNWWEVDVYMIGMPARLKKYWQGRLKTLVEEWSGVELELTDIYGMRRYEDGARLLTHVDRQATHATSLIVNIAQGAMREPWAIEVYDFAGRLHEVNMEEGDIVYYESARCLHGRMKPLKGAFYVNLFAHYRPIGDPDWFKKPNPTDNVPQLLDIGDCEVRGNGTFCSNGQGRVPHLSRHLETLRSHEDLFRYWQQTTPVVQVGGSDEL